MTDHVADESASSDGSGTDVRPAIGQGVLHLFFKVGSPTQRAAARDAAVAAVEALSLIHI